MDGAQKKMFMYENKIKIYLYVKPFGLDANLYECYDKDGKMLGYVPTKYEGKDISFNIKGWSLDNIEKA